MRIIAAHPHLLCRGEGTGPRGDQGIGAGSHGRRGQSGSPQVPSGLCHPSRSDDTSLDSLILTPVGADSSYIF